MWKRSECVGVKPATVDSTSSKKFVYVRKNFVKEVNADNIEVWRYLEKKILQDDWQTYTQIINRNSTVSDLEEAVIELAGLIGG